MDNLESVYLHSHKGFGLGLVFGLALILSAALMKSIFTFRSLQYRTMWLP